MWRLPICRSDFCGIGWTRGIRYRDRFLRQRELIEEVLGSTKVLRSWTGDCASVGRACVYVREIRRYSDRFFKFDVAADVRLYVR